MGCYLVTQESFSSPLALAMMINNPQNTELYIGAISGTSLI